MSKYANNCLLWATLKVLQAQSDNNIAKLDDIQSITKLFSVHFVAAITSIIYTLH